VSEPRPEGTLPPLELALETILFVAEGPVEIGRIQRALEIDRAEAEATIARLAEGYRGRGVRLQRRGETLQLVSAPEAAEYVERFLGLSDQGRLSAAVLETLAIIAYRQPIGRAEIEEIRGVAVGGVLKSLHERGLIDVVGRSEGLGRPLLYGTTPLFLEHFALRHLEELPRADELAVALRAQPGRVDATGPTADGEQAGARR
jgi:segregation and condensation protein B